MLAIGILMFDDVEILDFSGPYEVFSTAARVHGRRGGDPALFRCFLVSAEMKPVRARGGMKVLPDCVLPPAADLDLLIVPGGDVGMAMTDPVLIGWIRAQAARCEITASVCTGAFLLGEAGLLDGLPVTTHWEDQDALRQRFAHVQVRSDTPWIDCGKVVTSAGISAGIDMSLHLVERLAGRPLALATARQMEYEWNSDGYCEHSVDERPRRAAAGVFSVA
ncbi:DJ-1/PfpI family protein [Noviherbaspirillum sp.]|uniref:DJ-1/PfpI family protein n=1 Tax=Noviherbaspirillum sp. TaxID=1926288 RepID=UPI002FE3BB3F